MKIKTADMVENEQRLQKSAKSVSENGDIKVTDWIPSLFEPYNFKQVSVRRLKVREVKALAKLNNQPKLRELVSIFKNAVIDVNFEDLLIMDTKFLMLFISTITNPNFYIEGYWKCGNCGKDNHLMIKLPDIDWDDYDKTKYPIKYHNFTFRPVTLKDALKIEEFEKDLIEDEVDIGYAYLAISSFDKSKIDTLDYETLKSRFDEIEDLPYDPKLDEIIKTVYLDVKPFNTVCSSCNAKYEIEFPLDFEKVYL